MNFGAVPMATNWLQNFNQITVSVEMRGINALKAYYKCILLLPVKYMSWSGNNKIVKGQNKIAKRQNNKTLKKKFFEVFNLAQILV